MISHTAGRSLAVPMPRKNEPKATAVATRTNFGVIKKTIAKGAPMMQVDPRIAMRRVGHRHAIGTPSTQRNADDERCLQHECPGEACFTQFHVKGFKQVKRQPG